LAALAGDFAVLVLTTGAAAVDLMTEAVAPVPAARACAAIGAGAGAAAELAGACATADELFDAPPPHAVRISAELTTIGSAVNALRFHALFINDFLVFGAGFPRVPWCDR
jgi:coenzyme F420-reducing hydrogenase alpha subunit